MVKLYSGRVNDNSDNSKPTIYSIGIGTLCQGAMENQKSKT